MMIMQFADQGNLRHVLSSNFNNILWNDKINLLYCLALDLKNLHELEYSDIYSLGVIMAELSSGKPPFHKRKHDASLALEICNGLRPEFGKGTPDIYKKLAYSCMNAIPNQRPTANELNKILSFWRSSIY